MAEGQSREQKITGHERGAEWYDRVFEEEKEGWSKEYTKTSYYATWSVMADRIRRQGVESVLDIGCGPGQFACLLRDKGLQYYKGFDFSPKRIERAREVCPEFEFVAADAFEADLFGGQSYDAVICAEFLEHVERDLEILERIPAGTRVFITVPNFPHDEHVRHFEDARQVADRYGTHLEDFDVDVFTGGRSTHRFFLMEGVRNHDFQGVLAEKEREVSELEQQLAELRGLGEKERRRLEEANQSKEREVSELKRQLQEANRSKDLQSSVLNGQVEQGSRDVEALAAWLKELDVGISALLDSQRWKIGQAIGELHRKVTRRPQVPMAQDSLVRILQQFRAWEENRKREQDSTGDGAQKDKKSSAETSSGSVAELVGPATREGSRSLAPADPSTAGLKREWHFRNQPESRKNKTKVSVLAWDVGHNPMGRAYLLAQVLSRKFDVEIVGARFPRYGTDLWEPTRNGEVPVIDFPGQDFPAHFAEMEELAKYIDGDILFVSKARLPSYELGILAKQFSNRPLILDVDDHELSFFRERGSLTLKDVGALHEDRGFLAPHENIWTRYCESIIPLADGLTVSNAELQKRYGGEIAPHARDERTFDPALYDRDSIRAKFGFMPEDKVILFIGTPRLYKGVVEIAEALEKIGNPRYKLCVIGTITDHNLRERLEAVEGDHVRLFEDQPYQDLPANLSIGDLVCLLQDPESEVSKYQMPAKFTDALAMGIPILATNALPLRTLASEGLVEPLGDTPLDQKIEEIFSNYAEFERRAAKNRETFLAEYSHAAVAEKLENLILPLLHAPPSSAEGVQKAAEVAQENFLFSAQRLQ